MQQISQLGKVPPQCTDIENDILGLMMCENVFDTVSGILQPDSFYTDSNKAIFKAISTLARKGWATDLVSVVEQLKSDGTLELCGGGYAVSKLSNGVTSSAGIEGKCHKVIEKYILREIIRITGQVHNMAYDETLDAFEVLDQAENLIFEISNKHLSNDYSNLATGLVQVISRIKELRKIDTHVTGVPSGFKNLDTVTHGWQPTDLIILAARPSVGKTAFALNLAKNATLNESKPTNVGFFSLEMSAGQLINRVLSCQSEIYLERLLTGSIDDYQMKQVYDKGVVPLGNAKIFIDDSAGINMFQLRSKARRMVNKDKVGLIIIDYLQLMTGESKNSNREQEISKISRELKKMAKDLKVPVIALSQLSREIEKRTSKVPMLSDLRESGAIEQDADMVAFLYRPSMEEAQQDADLANIGMLTIKKHRHGKLEDFSFEVNNAIQKWSEIGALNNNWKPVQI